MYNELKRKQKKRFGYFKKNTTNSRMKRTLHLHVKVNERERAAIENVSKNLGISMSAAVGYSVTNISTLIERNNKLKEKR